MPKALEKVMSATEPSAENREGRSRPGTHMLALCII